MSSSHFLQRAFEAESEVPRLHSHRGIWSAFFPATPLSSLSLAPSPGAGTTVGTDQLVLLKFSRDITLLKASVPVLTL
jgi:hypothetical protein